MENSAKRHEYTPEMLRQQVELARAIAEKAHEGQVDKDGVDYIAHPLAVAAQFDPEKEPVRYAAALLHDVLEDNPEHFDVAVLRALGVMPRIIEVVVLLTRRDDVDPDDYYRLIAEDEDARAVKLADIAHNTDPTRGTGLPVETRRRLLLKYAHALEILGEHNWSLELLDRAAALGGV